MKKEMKERKSIRKISVIKRCLIILTIFIISLFTLSCIDASGKSNLQQKLIIDTTRIEMIDSPIDNVDIMLPHDSIRLQLIDEVHSFICKTTKNADPNLAEYLVDNALEHNIDLCFMMGQTQIETCFGTAGAGRKSSRRSLFGVIKKRYPTYDHAIEDYCSLLKKSYLVRGRTEQDLMRNYVTGSGYRYAGSKTYEKELRNAYNRINRSTSISELQKLYKEQYQSYLASLYKAQNENVDSLSMT